MQDHWARNLGALRERDRQSGQVTFWQHVEPVLLAEGFASLSFAEFSRAYAV